MQRHISSGAVVTRMREDTIEVLLMRWGGNGAWRLPKGTIDPGETREATAIRETREETGLEIALGEYIGSVPAPYKRRGETFLKETHYHLATEIGGTTDAREAKIDRVEYFEVDEAIRLLEMWSYLGHEALIVRVARSVILDDAPEAKG